MLKVVLVIDCCVTNYPKTERMKVTSADHGTVTNLAQTQAKALRQTRFQGGGIIGDLWRGCQPQSCLST